MPPPASPADPKDEWLALIGGEAGLAALRTTTLDGLTLEPLAARASAPAVQTRAAATWDICPLYALADPGDVRAAIAEDVAGGATCAVLKLATPGDFGLPPRFEAISSALADSPLDRLEVSLLPGDQYFGAAQVLSTLWEQTGGHPTGIRGALNADPLGTLARTGALEAGLWPSLELLGQFVSANMDAWPQVRLLLADGTLYHDAGASEAQELAAMLATVVEYVRVLDFEGVAAVDVLPHLTVGLVADADLFATIGKLRAARQLLGQLADALKAGAAAARIKLWATTSQRMLSKRAVHTNVLRNSIAAFGAGVGGADAITVLPHTWALGSPDSAARRLARNTHHLMAQECGLARVLDPGAGSGHIAEMTQGLAWRAWELFQGIEADGGMARVLLSGKLQREIGDMAARREAEVTGKKRAITGVTAFAAAEAATAVDPHPAPAPIERAATRVPSLPVRRLSAVFEDLEAKP